MSDDRGLLKGEQVTGEDWTMDDVEAVVQATLRDEVPSLTLMGRLGPNPPIAYLRALGIRFEELRREADQRRWEAEHGTPEG